MKQRIYQLSLLFAVVVLLASLLPQAATARPQAVTTPLYFDMVLDEARQKIYASDYDNGVIHIISMSTLTDLSTLAVGSNPAGIDISPDGSELAVALAGQGQIAFVDLSTLTVSQRVIPNIGSGNNQPYDVVYGRTGRLYSTGSPNSSGFDYLHVFDTATKLELGRSEEIWRANPRMAISADKNTLYISHPGFTPQQIYRVDISTDIPKQTAKGPHGPVVVPTLCLLPTGSVYTSWGQVWSGDLSTQLYAYPAGGYHIECAPISKQVFISNNNQVSVFDGETYGRRANHQFGSLVGVTRVNQAETKLYVSTTNGIKVVSARLKPMLYLPVLRKAISGIHGHVSLNGVSAAGITLELRWYSGYGYSWITRSTLTTDEDGYYSFVEPSLAANQAYYVRFLNTSGTTGQLYVWATRVLTSYTTGDNVELGNFDIADIPLVSPANYATVSLPVQFQWQRRPATPTDSYEFNMYGNGGEPYFFTNPPLGYVSSYQLEQMPGGFQSGTPYAWEVWVYSGDGGYGISNGSRLLMFAEGDQSPGDAGEFSPLTITRRGWETPHR